MDHRADKKSNNCSKLWCVQSNRFFVVKPPSCTRPTRRTPKTLWRTADDKSRSNLLTPNCRINCIVYTLSCWLLYYSSYFVIRSTYAYCRSHLFDWTTTKPYSDTYGFSLNVLAIKTRSENF